MSWSVPKPSRAQVQAGKKKCRENPVYAINVLRRVWDAQQPIEKETRRYAGSDGGRGWRMNETYALNAMYDQFREQGWMLTPEQMEMLMERMEPYVEQYIRLGNEATSEAETKKKAEDIQRTTAPPGSLGKKRKPMWEPGQKESVAAMLERMGD